jgi:RHS repeat-associated protein
VADTSTDTTAGGSVISLPKGGGAVSGLGEKFAPDPFTGAGSFTMPIAVPPGRLGLQPQLTLSYSSGGGNGPFGLGWQLNVPGVARKTANGVPRYTGADVFTLSGTEDLVPVGDRYRPRTEGLFARIEHRQEADHNFWQVHGRDGKRSRYGTPRPDGAGPDWRDPAIVSNGDRIFAWRITETTDPLGNLIRYEYVRDHDQPLLSRISYADHGARNAPSFLVTVELEYESRPDQFSDNRAGFEIRTAVRCRLIRVVTRTADGIQRTAKEYRFGYRQAAFNGVSLLERIDVVGIDGASTESMPPVTLTYAEFDPDGRQFGRMTGPALPTAPLSDPTLALVDMRGVGLPDVVELGATAQRYWRNAGQSRLEVPRSIEEVPSVSLDDPGVSFLDADGDGRPDLVVTEGLAGYFPMTFAARWSEQGFQQYRQLPSTGLSGPGVVAIDLDGDGLTDVLHSGNQLTAFFNDSDPDKAWQRSVSGAGAPPVDLSDPRVRLADMTGDGLSDIVVLRSGNLGYFPNLGHGKWGPMVTMRRSPRLPDGFDPNRLLLGDIDGDGQADLVFVEDQQVSFWGNRSGTEWTTQPVVVTGTPRIVDRDSVRLADVHGNGMSGVLFSRVSDGLWFLDVTGGVKPYLMNGIDNHMGARTTIRYQPSTVEFLRDDAQAASRWRTTLPFPVHVVSRVQVTDEISRGVLTTRYRYHHGYWDGLEREFRGFGMVEQLDTEAIPGAEAAPPTLTKRWFHLGPVAAVESDDWTELDLSGEYWPGDPQLLTRTPAQRDFLAGLPPLERRAALRTLRGQLLRSELYGLDGTAREQSPYTVTESVPGVRAEADDVYLPFSLGTRTTQWERGDEPMTRFVFQEEPDAYGMPPAQLAVAVPRGRDPRTPGTQPYLATYTTTEYARRDDPGHYLVDRVARVTHYELVNDGGQSITDFAAVAADLPRIVLGLTRTFYDGDAFTGLPLGELGEHGLPVRSEALAFTESFLDEVGLRPAYLEEGPVDWPAEYPQEFRDLMPALAGYRRDGDGFFCVTSRYRYDVHDPGRTPRGLLIESLDRFGASSRIEYDEHDLLPVRTTDAAGLVTESIPDYRVLQPRTVTDPNGNPTSVSFSPLGLVTARFVASEEGGGDQALPGMTAEYDLLAFDQSGQPVSVRSARRTEHDGGDTIVTIDFFDGFGRALQTRAQTDDTLLGDPTFGGSILTTGAARPNPNVARRTRDATDVDNVVVSGWQIYDNKGRVIHKYEPFFSTGYEYAEPADTELGERVSMSYDPRGHLLRTVNPDGSEQRVVPGIPLDLAAPDEYRPTPWESYTYDQNDNAGRTHPTEAAGYQAHWNTPTSVELDGLGRVTRTVVRNGTEELVTEQAYDLRGNLVSIVDALGRNAFGYLYDLAGRRWRADSADAGRHLTVFDAADSPVEGRDSKGAVDLGAFDPLRRPTRVWARDDETSAVTLRQRLAYGDEGTEDARAEARTRNLLGRLIRHHDEAGLLTVEAADFKGNILDSTRRVIADQPILDTIEAGRLDGWRINPLRLDWTPGPGQTLADLESELLEPAGYRTNTSFDALNRVTSHRFPADVLGQRRELVPEYGRSGRLQRLRLDDTVHVSQIGYDAKGQRTLIGYGNSLFTRYVYEPQTFRLARMRTEPFTETDTGGLIASDVPVQDFSYTYDLTGNVISVTDVVAGSGIAGNPGGAAVTDPGLAQLMVADDALVREFSYDPAYRLTTATGREHGAPPGGEPWLDHPRGTDPTLAQPYTEVYGYDAAGNVTSIEHRATGGFTRTFANGTDDNRLRTMTIGHTPFAYVTDGVGNVIRETSTRHFAFNHADQLAAFTTQTPGAEPSVHAQYLYDAIGQRVKRLVRRQGGAIEVTHYLAEVFEHHRWHGGENNHIGLMDNDRRFVLLRFGPAHPDDRGPAVALHLDDHLGSGVAVVDETGTLTNREEYTPYGETSFGSFTRKRYRYTGQERDEESGLAYHSARYLAPWLGRWLSCDPIGPYGGLNQYAYVSGNPMRLIDPSGLDFWDRVVGGVKALGGLLETAAGAVVVGVGAATSELGVGVPIMALGGLIMAHGSDTVVSGVRTAIEGEQVDSLTSQGLQAMGMSRAGANLADAGIGVAGSMGASAWAKAPVIANTVRGGAEANAYVHLTTAESKAAIEASAALGKGTGTVYAGRASLANQGTILRTIRTGLTPGTSGAVVAVPNAAGQFLRVPIPIGPITGWQRLSGTVYTPGAGSIDLSTGLFTRTGVGWNQVKLLTIDGAIMWSLRGAPGILPDPEPTVATPPEPHSSAAPSTPPSLPSAPNPLIQMREQSAPPRRYQPHISITKSLSD